MDTENSSGGSTPSTADFDRIDLPKETDDRGSLTYVEQCEHIPFEIERVYYIYDVTENSHRGEHAHRELEQVIIAANGSFVVDVDDGAGIATFELDDPAEGLYVSPMLWRTLRDFSEESVALMLVSDGYDEGDYIREYDTFLAEVERL